MPESNIVFPSGSYIPAVMVQNGEVVKLMRLRQVAFTVTELVVVSATIAVLTAMMLPAVSKAYQKAKETQCLNNLGQLGLAFNIYMLENNDTLPGSTIDPPGQSWIGGHFTPNSISDHYAEYDTHGGLLYATVPEKKIFRCDCAPDDKPISFSMNRILSQRKQNEFKKPHKAPLLLEERTNDDGNFSLLNYYLTEKGKLGIRSDYDSDHDNRLGHRHNGKDNVLFLDGHARKVNWNERCWLECLRITWYNNHTDND